MAESLPRMFRSLGSISSTSVGAGWGWGWGDSYDATGDVILWRHHWICSPLWTDAQGTAVTLGVGIRNTHTSQMLRAFRPGMKPL